jgi:sulfate adenylyltransferase
MLASDLGFSKADRNLNIERIGYVASEVTKAGGVALCAAIAPYAEARDKNRQLISQHGGYVEIYVSTPVSVCEERDTKGLYKKARDGQLKGLTGVDDPYEAPTRADIILDTTKLSLDESVKMIIDYLTDTGYLKLPTQDHAPDLALVENA